MPDRHAELIESRARLFERGCRELNITMSGDFRVSEADAARLLGCELQTLINWRNKNGKGPDWMIVAKEVTYCLRALAEFVERRRREKTAP